MLPQGNISFLSRSSIMDFDADFLTIRAGCLGCGGDHLNPDGAIPLPFLAQNMQFREVQWHQNAFFCSGFFCGMLTWQGLFSLRRLFLFEPSFNEGQASCSLSL